MLVSPHPTIAGERFPHIEFALPSWVTTRLTAFILQPLKLCHEHPDPLWHCPSSTPHPDAQCAECARENGIVLFYLRIDLLPESIRNIGIKNRAARAAAGMNPDPETLPPEGHWFANVQRAKWMLPGAWGETVANVLFL
jgi:hypothetical protein